MKKLSWYAKENGLTYRTAYNHFKKGLIEGAYQLPTGTVVIPDKYTINKDENEYIVTYARVSSSENKSNLISQSQRLIDFCNAKGWKTNENICEVGSGLNDNRNKLIRVLDEGRATKIVIEHKDRLTRFGFNYIKLLCKHIGCELVVVNNVKDDKEDLIQDFVSVITSFCARIYGQRRSKRNTEKLIKELSENTDA
jgi:predicted site-specific integrase-resolvase